MADVQKEHGFTPLAKDLLGAAALTLSQSEIRVFLAVATLTYGWHRKEDRIGSHQLAAMTELSGSMVRRIVRNLVERNVLTRRQTKTRNRPWLGIQKDYERWKSTGSEPGGVTASRVAGWCSTRNKLGTSGVPSSEDPERNLEPQEFQDSPANLEPSSSKMPNLEPQEFQDSDEPVEGEPENPHTPSKLGTPGVPRSPCVRTDLEPGSSINLEHAQFHQLGTRPVPTPKKEERRMPFKTIEENKTSVQMPATGSRANANGQEPAGLGSEEGHSRDRGKSQKGRRASDPPIETSEERDRRVEEQRERLRRQAEAIRAGLPLGGPSHE